MPLLLQRLDQFPHVRLRRRWTTISICWCGCPTDLRGLMCRWEVVVARLERALGEESAKLMHRQST